jgi:exodeoxyribonuclease VII large subunit
MGVITSTSGAALQDILKVLKKRYPLVKVIISPALVQGKESAHSIVKSIELINELPHLDVIILGRGGGSLEDLWSFNEEIVARAIFKSEIPIISAVGHETDFTISDFVADKRAATPSVAAEIAVPDIKDIYEQIIHLQKRSTQSIQHKLNLCRSYIEQINSRVIFKKPLEIVHKNYRVLDQISSNLNNLTIKFIQNKKEELRIVESEIISLSPKTILNSYNVELNQKKYELINNVKRIIELKRKNLEIMESKISALNPKAILERGYSIVTKRNKILINSSNVKRGDEIDVIFHRGKINAKVKKIYKD